jgi:hypothetical protein
LRPVEADDGSRAPEEPEIGHEGLLAGPDQRRRAGRLHDERREDVYVVERHESKTTVSLGPGRDARRFHRAADPRPQAIAQRGRHDEHVGAVRRVWASAGGDDQRTLRNRVGRGRKWRLPQVDAGIGREGTREPWVLALGRHHDRQAGTGWNDRKGAVVGRKGVRRRELRDDARPRVRVAGVERQDDRDLLPGSE